MGCCSEKMKSVKNKFKQIALSEEETIITMKEKLLPFSTINIQELDTVIRSNSSNGVLSTAQLRKAMTELNFDIETFTLPQDHIQILLKLLQNPQRLYDVKTVMLFGVLLCAGEPLDKSQILYSLYDINNTYCLQEPEIREMISELIDISVDKIPRIAIDNSAEPENFTISEKHLLEYINTLLNKKDEFLSQVIEVLFAGKKIMRKTEFIKCISDDHFLQTILWSFQIRLALVN
ncbi:hypothetical protein SteCoe_36971 [Stentor coeruleus]|uniref:EF-hand domain-containing protein n=1 Tax=Stentor coeruleus TaxID=5963 RepID=A0A1R2AP32_9CILI|nr:hypothetical protein SteCoe_36971 [Stentor coeruleus]